MFHYNFGNGIAFSTENELTSDEIDMYIARAKHTESKIYHFGDYKVENGIMYRCLQDTVKGVPVTNELYWEECDTTSELNRIRKELEEVKR